MDLPVEGLVAGGVSAVFNVIVNVRTALARVHKLEERLSTHSTTIKKLLADVASLRSGLRLEMDGLRDELDRYMRRSIPDTTPEGVERLRARLDRFEKDLDALNRKCERMETSLQRYFESRGEFVSASEFRHYVKEMQEQWNRLIRTMGQIEGLVKQWQTRR